jgi:hypothetical protein
MVALIALLLYRVKIQTSWYGRRQREAGAGKMRMTVTGMHGAMMEIRGHHPQVDQSRVYIHFRY